VALVVPDLEAFREMGAVRMREFIRDALSEQGRKLPSHARPSGFALALDKLPRTQLGKIRRHIVKDLYEAALAGHQDSGPAELNAEDKALLAEPGASDVWGFLHERFAPRQLALDMSPQLDLGIDSLAWVDLTMALERACGIRLTEAEIGRIVTLRDLLREARDVAGRPDAATEAAPPALPHLNAAHLLLRRLLTALNRAVMRRYFSLVVEGQEKLPAHGPLLICPNHESYLDPFAVAAALPPGLFAETWWGGWTGILFNTRTRRLFSRVAQIVPVDQSRGGSASLALGAQVFAQSGVLVWFPEGGLTRTGDLQPFLPGIGVLLDRHRVAVVPVAIEGSYEAWPRDGRRKRHPIRVRFGRPLAPDALREAGPPQAVADRLREAVVELAAG
jgi:long-chain acyl-CoA synthetase